ncbi:MAG: hypothetical protein LW865_15790 [Betaproteobacteria bacterium]|jgi:hypothetical protein|nr:hypothetical protein [Betaproteobacteria bacterium]
MTFLVRICKPGCVPFRYEVEADHSVDVVKAMMSEHGLGASVTVRAV